MEQMFYGLLGITILMIPYLSLRYYRKKVTHEVAHLSMVGAKIKGEEKRDSIRNEVTWPVTMELAEGVFTGETKNVSMSGAFICSDKIPPLQEKFRVVFNPPDHPAIIALAEVVWSNSNVPEEQVVNRGMGIRFLEISQEDREFIANLGKAPEQQSTH